MSERHNTTNRRTLYRICGTCGKSITTMADSPLVRSVVQPDKRHVTTYYCSSACCQASYKRAGWYNDKSEKQKKPPYYDRHREEILAKSKERYRSDPETAIKATLFYRKKRKACRASADQKGMNENV